MLALRSAPPVFGLAEALGVARDVYGLAGELSPLPGERDCNFHLRTADGRGYVLKIIDGDSNLSATDCQARVLRHLADLTPVLPVSRVYVTRQGHEVGHAVQDGRSHATLLMSYLDGTLLAEAVPSHHLWSEFGATLARLDRALRGFFHPALGQRIAWDVRRLPELMEHRACLAPATLRTVGAVAQAVGERLPQLGGLRGQAIHGDCHGANVLIDSGSCGVCGILDFGDMIHAPAILEPAVALSELLTQNLGSVDDLPPVLAGYAAVHALESEEIDVLFDLICGRHAVTLFVHAWREQHDAEGARALDQPAIRAMDSLDRLRTLGADHLRRVWRDAAGIASLAAVPRVDLARRQRLLGRGAELFYESPLELTRGEGVWLFDRAGRDYLDVYNNVPHVGHGHPAVVAAIQRQTATLVTHTRYLHPGILDYAEALTARCPSQLDACIFVNSGSEANDVAWRMAQFASGGRGALVMAHAYHGITQAVAALTPGTGTPVHPHVVALAVPPAELRADHTLSRAALAAAQQDADSAVGILHSRGFAPAAFFIDSALTSSGIHDPPPAWLAAVAARVRSAGGLVVADEVQYGLGRSGSHFWGFQRRGLEVPDIVTLGKPVGNGYPMGVVIANRGLIENFQAHFGFFSTFGGNPVAAAAGLAVLDVLDREQLSANARHTGEYLRARLAAIAARSHCLGAVRGTGLLLGLEVLGREPAVAKARTLRIVNELASTHRILVGSEGPRGNILKIRPPMVFRPAHADRLTEAIERSAALIVA